MKYTNSLITLLKQVPLNNKKIFFASLYSTINKICDIFPEILIGIAIDTIVNKQQSIIAKLGIINPFYQLYFVGFITTLLWMLEALFEYFYSISWHNIAQKIQHDLRLNVYAKIQALDSIYLENKTIGELSNILLDDINQLEQFLQQAPNDIIQLIVNVIIMGCIFFYLSPLLALLTLLPIPFIINIAHHFQHTLAHKYKIVRHTFSKLASHITYRLQGIPTIKSYTTEAYELESLNKESNLYRAANHHANRINALYIPIVRMAIMIGFILSLIVGGRYTLQGIIPINWYATLVFLTQRFLWPFTILANLTDMYEKTTASAKRILSILEKPLTINNNNLHLDVATIKGKIDFKNIDFSYSNGVKILDNISFEVPAQKTVAFVGATGSGKSTLVKLLLRFYDSTNGSILIDDYNIKNISLTNLRQSLALVSQETYLVEGSIADNISYGSFKASPTEIINAAKIAHAHDFIMDLPLGYDTKVQEHGKNLSGGQRQRISIARAIIKKSPILIFDEATSAIDNETECAIAQSITSLAAHHTIIIIAHRLATVRNADTIFVLKKGSIIESGNHETLLKQDGYYAYLWNIQ